MKVTALNRGDLAGAADKRAAEVIVPVMFSREGPNSGSLLNERR